MVRALTLRSPGGGCEQRNCSAWAAQTGCDRFGRSLTTRIETDDELVEGTKAVRERGRLSSKRLSPQRVKVRPAPKAALPTTQGGLARASPVLR